MNNNEAQIKHFKSDSEFADYCLAPYAEIITTESGHLAVDCKYSKEYLQDIEQGVQFVIEDNDSVVYKHQCVCKRLPVMHEGVLLRGRSSLIQLPVTNLQETDFE